MKPSEKIETDAKRIYESEPMQDAINRLKVSRGQTYIASTVQAIVNYLDEKDL